MASDKRPELQIENISDDTIKTISSILFYADRIVYFNKSTFEIVDYKNKKVDKENIIQIGMLKILDFLEEFRKHTKEDSPLVTLPDCYIERLNEELEYDKDFDVSTAVFNEKVYNKFFEVFGDKYFEVYPEIENSFIEIYELAERSCVLKWIKENT